MFRSFSFRLKEIGDGLSSYFLLLIRLYWGSHFVIAGVKKFLAFSATAGYFDTLGIPLPYLSVFLAATAEAVGGLCLVLGLYARVACIPLFVVMCVAYLTAGHASLASAALFFQYAAFLYLYAVLIVFCFGPGKISCDYWLTGAQRTKSMP